MVVFKEKRILKLKISIENENKIINRNIVVPLKMDNNKVFEILMKSIVEAKLISFSEEKVLQVGGDEGGSYRNMEGRIDKYWFDGTVFLAIMEWNSFAEESITLVCESNFNKEMLKNRVRGLFLNDKELLIDELEDCWILREKYHNVSTVDTQF